MFDLVIKNAVLGLPNGLAKGDLAIQKGRIAEIGGPFPTNESNFFDAAGCLLLPGGVDASCNFTASVGTAIDCWQSGSRSALAGGTTTVIEHLYDSPGVPALSAAGKSSCDYSLHGTLPVDISAARELLPHLREQGIISCQLDLSLCDISQSQLAELLSLAWQHGVLIMTLCQDKQVLARTQAELAEKKQLDACFYGQGQPAEAEVRGINRLLVAARQAGGAPVYIKNLSTAAGLQLIRHARQNGQRNIFCATCPQYLLLDDMQYYFGEQQALRNTCRPALRNLNDAAALWRGLSGGEINLIASDHCGFTLAGRRKHVHDFRLLPQGAPGVEERMNLLLSAGVMQKRISLSRALSLLCYLPAALFGLDKRKGSLQKGLDADLLLFDPKQEHLFTDTNLHGDDEYTLFNEIKLSGKITHVWQRGQLMLDNGMLSLKPGFGQCLLKAE